jgi:hypothetical protein
MHTHFDRKTAFSQCPKKYYILERMLSGRSMDRECRKEMKEGEPIK